MNALNDSDNSHYILSKNYGVKVGYWLVRLCCDYNPLVGS